MRVTILLSSLASIALAAPTACPTKVTASLIEQVMPTSNTCDGALDECRTATQAAPYFESAMRQYALTHPAQIAAVLALVGLESGDLKYKHNIWPGRPGQGTSAMFMPNYVKLYVESIPELQDQLTEDMDPDAILALVTPDEYNFGSGPWFLATQCEAAVRDELTTDPDAGFEAYMACVGVTVDEGRAAYWERAKTAFHL
ncbi:hypothetical protein EXIGLDRAFT_710010 [Exidia glandulosa HHB12029]|uniref:Lysozyme-like protein n=1 Tax=Exidia glandulosa HHB12029 TaxID=1314781 RepID=A0A165I7C2_EXIGL|nr:hypothetical protein EXIGLDRAFT_710010 [Exidia glandulosa HHB12029]